MISRFIAVGSPFPTPSRQNLFSSILPNLPAIVTDLRELPVIFLPVVFCGAPPVYHFRILNAKSLQKGEDFVDKFPLFH